MLDLRSGPHSASRFSQRFYDHDLPGSLSQAAFERFEPQAYAPEDIEQGRAAWHLRALDEYRSQVAFTDLLRDLTFLGVPFDLLSVCVRVVRDEARHVELCRRMVNALGGNGIVPGTPVWSNPPQDWPLRTRILWQAVGSLCIGETLSTSMIAGVRAHTMDPLAKDLMTQLLTDESIHGRLGWSILEYMEPTLSDSERQLLNKWLPGFLRDARTATLGCDEGAERERLNPFGDLPYATRVELYEQCMRENVLGPLAGLGLGPSRGL